MSCSLSYMFNQKFKSSSIITRLLASTPLPDSSTGSLNPEAKTKLEVNKIIKAKTDPTLLIRLFFIILYPLDMIIVPIIVELLNSLE